MFKRVLLFLVAASVSVRAAPALARSMNTDVELLQSALGIEYAVNAFYNSALDKFDHSAFAEAGYSSDVRNRFVEIRQHETEHLQTLKDVLGSNAVNPCFTETEVLFVDVSSFIQQAVVLENLSDAALIGVVQLLEDQNYLASIATVLSVEARHAAWTKSGPGRSDPFLGAFDEPIPAIDVLVALYKLLNQLECLVPIVDTESYTIPDNPVAPRSDIVARLNPMDDATTGLGQSEL